VERLYQNGIIKYSRHWLRNMGPVVVVMKFTGDLILDDLLMSRLLFESKRANRTITLCGPSKPLILWALGYAFCRH